MELDSGHICLWSCHFFRKRTVIIVPPTHSECSVKDCHPRRELGPQEGHTASQHIALNKVSSRKRKSQNSAPQHLCDHRQPCLLQRSWGFPVCKKWDDVRNTETLDHGFMTGGEQKQVEATMCYFKDVFKNCAKASSSLALSWLPQYLVTKTQLTDSLGGKEQATSGDRWDSTAFRLQSEVTKETLSHSLGLSRPAPQQRCPAFL